MTTRSYRCASILAIALLAGLAGCTPYENPEGVKDRWNRDKRLDLNTATKEQLMVLPGMTAAEADGVIAGRPYADTGELVRRGILRQNKYDKIADRFTVKIWRAQLSSLHSREIGSYVSCDDVILPLYRQTGEPLTHLIFLDKSSAGALGGLRWKLRSQIERRVGNPALSC